MCKKIEMGKQYRTREGAPVRILCVDREGDYPVIGLVHNTNIVIYTEIGMHYRSGNPDKYDLFEYNPADDLKVDQPIWVRDTNDREWVPRHFKGVAPNGNVQCWTDGRTSHTTSTDCADHMEWMHWSATNPNK